MGIIKIVRQLFVSSKTEIKDLGEEVRSVRKENVKRMQMANKALSQLRSGGELDEAITRINKVIGEVE